MNKYSLQNNSGFPLYDLYVFSNDHKYRLLSNSKRHNTSLQLMSRKVSPRILATPSYKETVYRAKEYTYGFTYPNEDKVRNYTVFPGYMTITARRNYDLNPHYARICGLDYRVKAAAIKIILEIDNREGLYEF